MIRRMRIETAIALASFALYLVSFVVPFYDGFNGIETFDLGIPLRHITISWFAHPILWAAYLLRVTHMRCGAAVAAVAALTFAATNIFTEYDLVDSMMLGYWIWVSSIMLLILSALSLGSSS